MNIFPCATCAAKSETIELLKQQLSASQERENVLQKANLALVDARAHAQVYRKPRPESVPSDKKPDPQSSWGAMEAFVPDRPPLTKEDIEQAFREPAGVMPAGIQMVKQ